MPIDKFYTTQFLPMKRILKLAQLKPVNKKFSTLDPQDILDLEVRRWYEGRRVNSSSLDVCVVYCVWSNPKYLSFLLFSLLSQIYFTDIESTTIKVFVTKNLFKQAFALLSFMDITPIIVESCTKYSITLHPELSSFKHVVIVDCDTYFWGQKINLYKQIAQTDHMYMMRDRDNCLKTFLKRHCLCYDSGIETEEQYLKIVAGFMGMSGGEFTDLIKQKGVWYLSCLISFPCDLLHGKEWSRHVEDFTRIQSFCDETVFLTYLWKLGLDSPRSLNELQNIQIVLWEDYLDYINSSNRLDSLAIVHPLHGTLCEDDNVELLYNQILIDIENQDCTSRSKNTISRNGMLFTFKQFAGDLLNPNYILWSNKQWILKQCVKCDSSTSFFFENYLEVSSAIKQIPIFTQLHGWCDSGNQEYIVEHIGDAQSLYVITSIDTTKKAVLDAFKAVLELAKLGYSYFAFQPANLLVTNGSTRLCDVDAIQPFNQPADFWFHYNLVWRLFYSKCFTSPDDVKIKWGKWQNKPYYYLGRPPADFSLDFIEEFIDGIS